MLAVVPVPVTPAGKIAGIAGAVTSGLSLMTPTVGSGVAVSLGRGSVVRRTMTVMRRTSSVVPTTRAVAMPVVIIVARIAFFRSDGFGGGLAVA